MPAPSHALPPSEPRSLQDDDVELELPPLDGPLDDSAPRHEWDDIEEAPALGDDDGGTFDLDPASELDAVDDATGEGSEAARDAVDVGSLADTIALPDEGPRADPPEAGRALPATTPRAADDRGLAHELDDDASPFDVHAGDDAGCGTGDDLGGFIDEAALPPLGDDDATGEGLPAGAAPAESSLAWDRGRYRLAAGLGADVPCGAVTVSPAYVVAAGPSVLVVVDRARVTRGSGPDVDAVALAVTEATIVAASRRGDLLASADGGATWLAAAAPGLPALSPIALAATPGRLWIGRSGALWSQRYIGRGRPEPQVLVRKSGVRAMAASGTSLLILAELPGALALERLRGDDEPSAAEPLPADVSAAAAEGALLLASAAGGSALALITGDAAHVSRDGGASFDRHLVGPALAAAFAGTGADAPLMVLARGPRPADRASLVEIDGRGACVLVAEVAGAGDGPASLAWDPARDVLWLASAAGLLAFERSARH